MPGHASVVVADENLLLPQWAWNNLHARTPIRVVFESAGHGAQYATEHTRQFYEDTFGAEESALYPGRQLIHVRSAWREGRLFGRARDGLTFLFVPGHFGSRVLMSHVESHNGDSNTFRRHNMIQEVACCLRRLSYGRCMFMHPNDPLWIGDSIAWAAEGGGPQFVHRWADEAPDGFCLSAGWSEYRIYIGRRLFSDDSAHFIAQLEHHLGESNRGISRDLTLLPSSRTARKVVSGRWNRLATPRATAVVRGRPVDVVQQPWKIGFELEAISSSADPERELPMMRFHGDGSVHGDALEWATVRPWGIDNLLPNLRASLEGLAWDTDSSCGGHVHVSGWRNALVPLAAVNFMHCGPGLAFADFAADDRSVFGGPWIINELDRLVRGDPYRDPPINNRYRAVNLASLSKHGTVEFRLWSGFADIPDIASKVLASYAITKLVDALGAASAATYCRAFAKSAAKTSTCRAAMDELKTRMIATLCAEHRDYVEDNKLWRGEWCEQPIFVTARNLPYRLRVHSYAKSFYWPQVTEESEEELYNVRDRRIRG